MLGKVQPQTRLRVYVCVCVCVCIRVHASHSVMSNSLRFHDCSPPGSSAWDSPGKNTGVGCHF